MALKITESLVHLESGDRILILEGSFFIRFKAGELDDEDPWMVFFGHGDPKTIEQLISGSAEYEHSERERQFAYQCLLKAYGRLVESLGILI